MENQKDDIYFSVVIPTYSERHRIRQTLDEIKPYLCEQSWKHEVIIVDDISPDGTADICREYAKEWPEIKVLVQDKRYGKGASVKRGCLEARGKHVLVMDADHPTPIDTCEYFFPLMHEYDAVVGVRTFSGEEGASGRFRRIVGLMQQLLAHIIVFKRSVADSQCGFKMFSNAAAKQIFSRIRVNGGMYDVEIFCISHCQNLRVYSKPVKWVNKDGSRINILRCAIQDPISLLMIAWNDLRGCYA